jgi:hypothetical protein
MSPEVIIGLVLAALPGVLAAGGLWWRVSRLESDVRECVRRDVHAEQQRGLKTHLRRIERMLETISQHLFPAGAHTPQPGGDGDDE